MFLWTVLVLSSYNVNAFFSKRLLVIDPIVASRSTSLAAQNGQPSSFKSQFDYLEYLQTESKLPQGFAIGTTRFNFKPMEVDKTLPMNITIIKMNEPTSSFAAMFTSNLFPGGPVFVGKERIKSSQYLQAVIVNNKISNVCPGGIGDSGAGDSDLICNYAAEALGLPSKSLVI